MGEVIYQVVSEERTEFFNSEKELLNFYTKTGTKVIYNIEAPTLKGLYGPMYNGKMKGKTVIRYETKEIYLSFD